ncbi:hypothetical protein [Absidia glauca]|uniref:Protein kinase domain-containing protein n=1 Tax=Absidia glauca TaxID=4829 RepID=A0A168LFU5_ABSGL|nr:hypothetical protein [Absidia glauca]
MYNLTTTPKDTTNSNSDHFFNYFKEKTNDDLHIDTQSLGIHFQHGQQIPHRRASAVSPLTREPFLSPVCSPTSSSSSSSLAGTSPKDDTAGLNIPHTQPRVRRNKSIITRKTSAPSQVTSQSYDHIKSPAASFLASFASPPSSTSPPSHNSHRPSLTTFFEEQSGDEIDDYVMNQMIGSGGFSTVRKGYCISNGQTVAIKIIKKKPLDPLSADEALERELEIWQTLDHANVVRIQKVLETDHATFVVCDYCANGTLLDRLLAQPTNPLSDSEKKHLFSQLCSAVHYLHKKCNVIHRDIKLDNVLLDDAMNVKLCDFGLAVYQKVMPTHLEKVAHPDAKEEQEQGDHSVGGSLAYCAPEQLKSSKVLACPKTDVWSLGVVLFAMFAGRLPFDDDYDVRLRKAILSGEFVMPDDFPPELADLVSHCLDLDPVARYSLDQIIDHPWLKN